MCEEDTLGVSPVLSPKGVHLAEVLHAETHGAGPRWIAMAATCSPGVSLGPRYW